MFATFSALQCLPVQGQQSSEFTCIVPLCRLLRRWPLTKVGGARVGNIINKSFGMLKISLAKTNSNWHHFMAGSAIALTPLMRNATPLLVKDVVGIRIAGSRTAGGYERGRSHNREETHLGRLEKASTDGTPSGAPSSLLKDFSMGRTTHASSA